MSGNFSEKNSKNVDVADDEVLFGEVVVVVKWWNLERRWIVLAIRVNLRQALAML